MLTRRGFIKGLAGVGFAMGYDRSVVLAAQRNPMPLVPDNRCFINTTPDEAGIAIPDTENSKNPNSMKFDRLITYNIRDERYIMSMVTSVRSRSLDDGSMEWRVACRGVTCMLDSFDIDLIFIPDTMAEEYSIHRDLKVGSILIIEGYLFILAEPHKSEYRLIAPELIEGAKKMFLLSKRVNRHA